MNFSLEPHLLLQILDAMILLSLPAFRSLGIFAASVLFFFITCLSALSLSSLPSHSHVVFAPYSTAYSPSPPSNKSLAVYKTDQKNSVAKTVIHIMYNVTKLQNLNLLAIVP